MPPGPDRSSGDKSSRASFPHFMQLPPELRSRVWELFCPDLVTKARLLWFLYLPDVATTVSSLRYYQLSGSAAATTRSSTGGVWFAKDEKSLAVQTETLRNLMAAHRESRARGLRVYQHSLTNEDARGHCDSIVRFNKQLDIIHVEGIEHWVFCRPNHQLRFAESIVNLAIM